MLSDEDFCGEVAEDCLYVFRLGELHFSFFKGFLHLCVVGIFCLAVFLVFCPVFVYERAYCVSERCAFVCARIADECDVEYGFVYPLVFDLDTDGVATGYACSEEEGGSYVVC